MSEASAVSTALAVLAILKSHSSCSSVSGPPRFPLNPVIAASGPERYVKARVHTSRCVSAAGSQRLVLQPASLPSTLDSRNLVCCDCRHSFLASELLIDQLDPGFSWQGNITKRCFSCCQSGLPSLKRKAYQFCFDEPEAAARKRFKKAVALGWKDHKRANLQHVEERVRVVNYNRFKQALPRMLGEDDYIYRQRVLAAMSAFAVRVVAAVTRASPQMQAAYVQATHEWQRAYMEVAADSHSDNGPEQFLQVREACMTHLLIPSHLSEFMTSVVEGVNIDWICRRVDCLMVVHAAHWIKRSECHKFRCPSCGERYRPWYGSSYSIRPSDTFIDAQKVLCLEAVASVATGVQECSELADIRKDASSVDSMFLMQWPDTSTQSLIDKFMVITAQLHDEIRCKSDHEIVNELRILSERTCNPRFSWQQVSDDVLTKIEDLNVCSPKKPPWMLDHIPDGYLGFKYPFVHDEVILGYEETMRMLGLARYVLLMGPMRCPSRL